MAVTGKSPSHHYRDLEEQFGRSVYERMDVPANREEKAVLKSLSPEQVPAKDLAGDPIVRKITNAPANNAPLGGLKVESEHGWFAARPSGTEDVYKIYAESFKGESHLKEIQNQAIGMVDGALGEETGKSPIEPILSRLWGETGKPTVNAVKNQSDLQKPSEGSIQTHSYYG